MTPPRTPRRRPRTLVLNHAAHMGGAERSLLDVAGHLRSTCHVMLFADGPARTHLERAGVSVQVLSAPAALLSIKRDALRLADLRAIPAVAGYIHRIARIARSFDVVLLNSQKAFVIGALAARLAGRPAIWHQRDLLSAEHFGPIHRRLAVTLANHAVARVIAVSAASAESMRVSGVRADKLHVVYNGIDPGRFDAVSHDAVRRLRQELGLVGVPLVGLFGRISPWKGQHVLVEALRNLPRVHALLVGDAIFGEDAYRDELEVLVKEADLSHRVHFLGFRDDVAALMEMADIVVHTSVAPEPFGRVIVEGMLAGKPVVATAAGGATEIVRDGSTGLLVKPGDAEALAGALRRLFADPNLAVNFGAAGRQVAREEFSLPAMLSGVEGHINEVADLRRIACRESPRTECY
jgi:glycosyltransferase involved in cell wall biosynthesis